MDKKLTLSLNEKVIEKAKTYAKMNDTSLSKLIESYLSNLTRPSDKKEEITPLVKSLIGIIKVPKDFNEKEAYIEYLSRKYK